MQIRPPEQATPALAFWQSPEALDHVYVSTPGGAQVPLSAFSRYGPTNTPLGVNHQGQFAASTISFNLPVGGSLSDATRAVKDGDHYVLNGSKNFITNAPYADTCVLFTMTDKAKSHKGITAFVIDMKWKGVSLGKHEKKMGIKASATSSIILEDVRVPAKNRLGNEGDGFKVAMNTLDGGRIGVASQAIGIARASLEDALSYSKDRKQFGQAICEFQAIQWMLADIATEIDAARLLTWRAAWMKDRKMRHSKESSMAKLYASEVAMRAAVKGVQIHGGYGYINEYPAERHFRDAKITEIYEGTSEIQRLVIAAALLKE